MFTPKLRKAYMDLKAQGKELEIVFCSADNSVREFKEYFDTMPWTAIPFEQSQIRDKLSRKFGISGIPTLLLLNEQDGMYNNDGRNAVMSNPAGFPWKN